MIVLGEVAVGLWWRGIWKGEDKIGNVVDDMVYGQESEETMVCNFKFFHERWMGCKKKLDNKIEEPCVVQVFINSNKPGLLALKNCSYNTNKLWTVDFKSYR